MWVTYPIDYDNKIVSEDARTNIHIREKLSLLSGTNELEGITHLHLRLYPAGHHVLHESSSILINLSSLSLSGNVSLDLRDFNSSLPNLKELSIAKCHLKSLDGIASFPNLTDLYASNNEISNLRPCMFLKKMCHLDVESNAIDDIESVGCLVFCPRLESVVLRNNPFLLSSNKKESHIQQNYSSTVFEMVPQLKYLDRPKCPSSANPVTSTLSRNEGRDSPRDISCLRNYSQMDDYDLFSDRDIPGSRASFVSDRSETLSSLGDFLCGSPGRAFKSGILSCSNLSSEDATSDTDD